MAGTIKHRHQTALAAGSADVDRNEWNDSLVAAGGSDGQVMTRDAASADGWHWATPPVPANTIVLIQEQILLVDTATFSFTAIPATYRHLRLVIYGRITESVTDDYVYAQYNADTGANYDFQHAIFFGTGGSSISQGFAQTKVRLGELAGASASSASQAGVTDVMIPYYANTSFFKNSSGQLATTVGVAGNTTLVGMVAGHWRSTSAINRIDLIPQANNFKSGTIASLYGML